MNSVKVSVWPECGKRSQRSAFYDEGKIRMGSNHSGGINGGITNGMPILFESLSDLLHPSARSRIRLISVPARTKIMVTGATTHV